jgi:predicted O-methyltransferase YrrM
MDTIKMTNEIKLTTGEVTLRVYDEPTIFDEIISLKDGPVQYERVGTGNIKMVQHPYPYSIKLEEFNFLTNLIKDNNLQRGYECATAFGISSIAIGLGFKETGGKCVTMDAYIEEKCGDAGAYEKFEREVYEKADGFKSVKYLIEKYNLGNTLYPEIGWSPTDTESAVRKHINEPLDFVFIDAGHFPEQMIKDFDAFLPLLGEKYVLAFHDVYPWSYSDMVHDHIYKKIGKRVEIKVPHPAGENLGVIINL